MEPSTENPMNSDLIEIIQDLWLDRGLIFQQGKQLMGVCVGKKQMYITYVLHVFVILG